ncbi:hypothetical protein QFZ60_000731 [Arthrobacter sp. B2I5]|nr:hypothetical protein [Arthrobacter sp. B2I5]
MSGNRRYCSMPDLLRLLASVVIAGCLAGTAVSCATPPSKSGINGHVTVDAGCPETMDSTPCPDIPLPAHITVKDRSGTTVGEATSNDQGEFRLELQAGTYELQAANLSGAPMPSAPSQDVVIKEGSFTEVRVAFDSGVR